MTIRFTRTFGIAITSAWLAVAAVSSASAQSYYYPPTPPQGPPPNQSDSSQAFTIDTFITRHCCDEATGAKDGLYDQIEQAIAENNAAYGVASTGAVVTATKTRYAPTMWATQYTNRPNQNIVRISYYIDYEITSIYWQGVPYPFSRTAGQSIDIDISCEGWYPWYQGKGELTLTSRVAAPVLDTDHSIIEDTIGGILWQNVLPQYVDSQITAKLKGFGKGTHSRGLGIECNTLGRKSFADSPQLDQVLWDLLQPGFIVSTLRPQLSVRVLQVQRLAARDLFDNPLYYAVETPRLEVWVGYNNRITIDLPEMVEGQIFVPDASAVASMPVPPSNDQIQGRVVLIANMQHGYSIEDTALLTFDKAASWGVGTPIVNTPKLWWYRSRFSRKPILMRSDGYEVTLQVSGGPIKNYNYYSVGF
jgi:hypothetical protein